MANIAKTDLKMNLLEACVEVSGITYTHKVKGLPDHDYWLLAKPKIENGTMLHIIVYNPSTSRSNKVMLA